MKLKSNSTIAPVSTGVFCWANGRYLRNVALIYDVDFGSPSWSMASALQAEITKVRIFHRR